MNDTPWRIGIGEVSITGPSACQWHYMPGWDQETETNPQRHFQAICRDSEVVAVVPMALDDWESIVTLIYAAPDLLAACNLLEAAEDQQANCEECGDAERFPELCESCFPLFDKARLARRAAIAKAEGTRSERVGEG